MIAVNDAPVVHMQNVRKTYPLYKDDRQKFMASMFPRWHADIIDALPTKDALSGLSLDIGKGEKVGVIGHNGSGKTTLLKLISGFSRPTSGEVQIQGDVQALMTMGGNAIDDFTGLESINAAIAYSGLPRREENAAVEDILDFVELGQFIHHPVRTYSMGMRARLEFAIATAIRPTTLLVDEVLGAGDGYFARKSSDRIRGLFGGTTLILVSHSMQQIIEFCDRVIWLEAGGIRQDGPAQQVVKDYEQYMAELSAKELGRELEKSPNNDGIPPDEMEAAPADEVEGEEEEPVVSLDYLAAALPTVLKASTAVFGETPPEDAAKAKLSDIRFLAQRGTSLVCETGDVVSLEATLDILTNVDDGLFVSIYALSENGEFMWEAGPHKLPETKGSYAVEIKSDAIGAGVGTYFLSLVLHDNKGIEGGGVLGVCHSCCFLKLLETNYSDPPFLHCAGSWRVVGKSGETTIPGRINAWV